MRAKLIGNRRPPPPPSSRQFWPRADYCRHIFRGPSISPVGGAAKTTATQTNAPAVDARENLVDNPLLSSFYWMTPPVMYGCCSCSARPP